MEVHHLGHTHSWCLIIKILSRRVCYVTKTIQIHVHTDLCHIDPGGPQIVAFPFCYLLTGLTQRKLDLIHYPCSALLRKCSSTGSVLTQLLKQSHYPSTWWSHTEHSRQENLGFHHTQSRAVIGEVYPNAAFWRAVFVSSEIQIYFYCTTLLYSRYNTLLKHKLHHKNTYSICNSSLDRKTRSAESWRISLQKPGCYSINLLPQQPLLLWF